MAIISEILLKDSYSSKVNQIEFSLSRLDSKFKKVSNAAKNTQSAFSKAFGKTHEVKIKDVKSKKVRKDLQKMQSELRQVTGKDYQVKITTRMSGQGLKGVKSGIQKIYTGGVSRLKGGISGFKEKAMKVKVDVSAFFKARREAKRLSKELTKATGKKHKVKIDVPRNGLGIIGSIRSKLSSLKGFKLGNLFSGATAGASKLLGMLGKVAAGLAAAGAAALGAGAIAGVASMVKGASELEQQKVSMTHFLGGDEKKSAAYTKALRKNANETPFETSEVLSAGTRAVQIAGGDTDKGMKFVKLAEDMAALNPGKTISDAMEALADADMGEMERLNFSLAA